MPITDTNPSLQPALRLDGRTAVLGILGDPVAQVKAPAPLTARLQQAGLNAVLVPMHVRADDVGHPAASACSRGAQPRGHRRHRAAQAARGGTCSAIGLLPGAERANARRERAAPPPRRAAGRASCSMAAGFRGGPGAPLASRSARPQRSASRARVARAIGHRLRARRRRRCARCDVRDMPTRRKRAASRTRELRAHRRATPAPGTAASPARPTCSSTPRPPACARTIRCPMPASGAPRRPLRWPTSSWRRPPPPLLALARIQRGCIAHEGRHMMERAARVDGRFLRTRDPRDRCPSGSRWRHDARLHRRLRGALRRTSAMRGSTSKIGGSRTAPAAASTATRRRMRPGTAWRPCSRGATRWSRRPARLWRQHSGPPAIRCTRRTASARWPPTSSALMRALGFERFAVIGPRPRRARGLPARA
jgi:shikimate dehydrogenase